MDLLWFAVGFFVGGSIGITLMAAVCAASRSDYSGREQLWARAFEGTEIFERVIKDDEEYNKLYGFKGKVGV
jgi:hypothetical protein